MPWRIVPQMEKHGKQEIEVRCKHVKFFPKHDSAGNVEGFGKLSRVVLKVIVENHKGLILNITAHGDMMDPKFTISHPDKLVPPMVWVGQGKTRRKAYDYLGKDVTVPGEKEKYPYLQDFEKRINFLFGKEVAAEVMEAFISRFASMTRAKLAA